ncbi:hypothetical protein NC651_017111 [Populus alba x Populus x berolinensis]|nr:hypothetical protein NC651_017111 [Populus alba x Populus x berolinensis]
MFAYTFSQFSMNREACCRRGRKLCIVYLLYSYRCWRKSCFMVSFAQKCSLCWIFWSCFWTFCLVKITWDWRKILESMM